MQDQQVVQAFMLHTPHEPLTDGIGSRGMIRGCENLDTTRLGNPREGHPKFAIIISDEILRTLTISGGFSKLLRGPSVRGRSRHADVDHLPRVQFDDEEGKERAKE